MSPEINDADFHKDTFHAATETFQTASEQHAVGKQHTQKIESKHINRRTRIPRLVRRTFGFSKTPTMHDLAIGLFINR